MSNKTENIVQIDIQEMNDIFQNLIAMLQKKDIKTISLEKDLYWDISDDQLYNPYTEPNEISLGQLFDDYLDLSKHNKESQLTPHDFKLLSTLLRFISSELL